MADIKISQTQLSEEFMKHFNLQKDKLSCRINELSTVSTETQSVDEKLSDISSEIQKLSKSLHDAVMFLPSYSIKIRQNEIRDLERSLKEKEDMLIPKKKFGFKSKFKPQLAKEVDNNMPSESNVPQTTGVNAVPNMISNYFTIENIKHQTVHYGEGDLNGNDVLVKNSEECVVVLEGGPSTLRLLNLRKCKLLCGPVRTSIFIDSVSDSTLYLCCQQLRTHSSERLDIYLRVASRAIIEDCKNIRFGPYKWDHENSEELHKKAEIDSNLQRFDAVDDFNWLSASQSPNWSIIPDIERKVFSVN